MTDSVGKDQIRAFIERIERMEEEKKAISDDIKEIYAEAKGNGLDTKVLRTIVRIRKMDHNERMEQEAILELYMVALGMAVGPRDDGAEEPPRGNRASSAPSITEPAPPPEQKIGSSEQGAAAAADSNPIRPETANVIHERASINDEASPEAGPQAEAFHSQGTGAGTLADREARIEGQAVSADLPAIQPPVASDQLVEANAAAQTVPASSRALTSPVESEPVAISTPIPKQWTFEDPPHPGCTKPKHCGGFSNLGLCQFCKDAAAQSEAVQ
jgi:uncharacterized protein (UPF0335 family)